LVSSWASGKEIDKLVCGVQRKYRKKKRNAGKLTADSEESSGISRRVFRPSQRYEEDYVARSKHSVDKKFHGALSKENEEGILSCNNRHSSTSISISQESSESSSILSL